MNQFVYFVTIEIHVYKKYIYQSKIIIKHGLFANVWYDDYNFFFSLTFFSYNFIVNFNDIWVYFFWDECLSLF